MELALAELPGCAMRLRFRERDYPRKRLWGRFRPCARAGTTRGQADGAGVADGGAVAKRFWDAFYGRLRGLRGTKCVEDSVLQCEGFVDAAHAKVATHPSNRLYPAQGIVLRQCAGEALGVRRAFGEVAGWLLVLKKQDIGPKSLE